MEDKDKLDETANSWLARIIDDLMEAQKAYFESEEQEEPDSEAAACSSRLPGSKRGDSRADNPSTEGLGWDSIGEFIFGFVYQVNGPGSVEYPFAASRYELELLARHWMSRYLSYDAAWVVDGYTGTSDCREHEYAKRRLARIAEVVGEEVVREIAEEEKDKFLLPRKTDRDDGLDAKAVWCIYFFRKLMNPEGGLPLVDLMIGPWLKQLLGLGPKPQASQDKAGLVETPSEGHREAEGEARHAWGGSVGRPGLGTARPDPGEQGSPPVCLEDVS